MKCIRCATDNNLKDRLANNGRCSNCQHQFVFEPTNMTGVKFTDPFFAKAIADISVNKSLFFTPKQFHYFLDKRLDKKNFNWLNFNIFIFIFICLFFTIIGGIYLRAIASIFIPRGSDVFVFICINVLWLAIYMSAKPKKYQQQIKKARILQIVGGIFLILGIVLSVAVFNSLSLFVISTILGMLSIYFGTRILRGSSNNIPQDFIVTDLQIQDWLNQWNRINHAEDKILPTPEPILETKEIEAEITNYSFDRALICDTDEIAQFLISNNFHFEHNCPVLSINGYPQNIFHTVLNMLRRNPELKVYVLHNASAFGISLSERLKTSNDWFGKERVTIYDLGLLPRQILKNPNIFVKKSAISQHQAQQLSLTVRGQLSQEELIWLESGNMVELESFSPQQLLKIIVRGIAQSNAPENESTLIPLEDNDREGVYIYSTESFG